MIYVHVPTYARTALLAEALESVRRQTYRGEITILLANDCPWQTIGVDTTDWPMNMQVALLESKERHPSLGAKRQSMLDATPRDAWIAFLDDDDLWMPHYLAQSMSLAPGNDVIISQSVFYQRLTTWSYEDIPGGIPMLAHAGWARRSSFPLDCSYGEDNLFRGDLLSLPGIKVVHNKRPGYVVRAGGDHTHASMASSTKFMLEAEVRRERKIEPEGPIIVRPAWREDYEARLRASFPEVF